VSVRPDAVFSRRFPEEMVVRIAVSLADGRRFEAEQSDYEGFRSRPLSWDRKIRTADRIRSRRGATHNIREAVGNIESMEVCILTRLVKDLDRETAA
jgi:2-methylcitrate dehydratase